MMDSGGLAREPVSLAGLLDGSAPGVVTSADSVLPEALEGLAERPLGIGDRRDLLLGASIPLDRLPAGTAIASPDARSTALLRAHHPRLRPTAPGASRLDREGGERLQIRPLWPAPELESSGEVLEPASWLPAPGQGLAVLLHRPEVAHRFQHLPADPHTGAILTAERAVGAAFPAAVPLVQGWVFGEWLGLGAVILSRDGRQAVRGRLRGSFADPLGLAERLVALLMDRGAAFLKDAGAGSHALADPAADSS
jgi:hypothetical protein